MKARKVKKLDPEAPLVDNAARILRVRLDEMRSFAPEALEPDAEKAQHDMRIAAKRLRYVLEVTGFCFGRSAGTARRRAKELQEILGEIHDCDVTIPVVQAQLDDLRARDAAARAAAGDAHDLPPEAVRQAPNRRRYRGVEAVATYAAARRELLYGRFIETWSDLAADGFRERVERAVAA